MAGFGDAFTNAYLAGSANDRAAQANERDAQEFKNRQQDREEARANLQALKDAASTKFKPRDDSVKFYDDPGNATADPTSTIGLGDTGIGASAPAPQMAPRAAMPMPEQGAPAGFRVPAPPQITRAPVAPTGAALPVGQGDVDVRATRQSGPPAAQAVPGISAPDSLQGPVSDVTKFSGQRVPVRVNGETRYVNPDDAAPVSDVDRLHNIASALYKQGDYKGAIDAQTNAMHIESGQIELDRQKTLQNLSKGYALGGQAALDARDAAIGDTAGGHTTKTTMLPNGNIHVVDMLNGHQIGQETIAPQGTITPMMLLQQRDYAIAGDPTKFQDYITNLSTLEAHGVVNAHTKHEDMIADKKLPGELGKTKAETRLAYSQAGYYDRMPTSGNGKDKDGGPEAWSKPKPIVVKDADGNAFTLDTRSRSGQIQYYDNNFGTFVDPKYAEFKNPNLFPTMAGIAKERGLKLAVDPEQGIPMYQEANPAKGATPARSMNPDDPALKGRKPPPPVAPKDNNGAGRIVRKAATAFGRAAVDTASGNNPSLLVM